jgi:hypothetical protein
VGYTARPDSNVMIAIDPGGIVIVLAAGGAMQAEAC